MFRNIVIDAQDVEGLADFWSAAARFERGALEGNYVTLSDPAQPFPRILIQKVPEARTPVKNRLHLDLTASTPDEMKREVARLERLGAKQVQVIEEDDDLFTVLTDPEGNEFCVVVA